MDATSDIDSDSGHTLRCRRDVTGDVSWRGALRSWRGGVGTFGYGSTPHAGSLWLRYCKRRQVTVHIHRVSTDHGPQCVCTLVSRVVCGLARSAAMSRAIVDNP